MPRHAADLLSIPPDLDRALARTVLADVQGARAGADDAGPSDALTAVVTRVVDALGAQGARASEVLLAIEDAFAALLAGQRYPAQRERLHALDVHARELVAARLGYAR